MLAFLESLRKKSKVTRDRYAFYGASLVTLLIASAWLLTLPSRYEHINDLPISETKDDTSGGFARALGDIKSQFATVLEGLNKPEEVEGDEASGDTPATSSPYNLDVEAVFNSGRATSTGTTTAPTNNTPKTVLIATTSATTTPSAIAQ